QNDTQALPQMPQIDLAQIGPVDFNETAVIAIDGLKQASDRGFAGAAAADHADHRGFRYFESHLIKGGYLTATIMEGDVTKADGTREAGPHATGGRIHLQRPV